MKYDDIDVKYSALQERYIGINRKVRYDIGRSVKLLEGRKVYGNKVVGTLAYLLGFYDAHSEFSRSFLVVSISLFNDVIKPKFDSGGSDVFFDRDAIGRCFKKLDEEDFLLDYSPGRLDYAISKLVGLLS